MKLEKEKERDTKDEEKKNRERRLLKNTSKSLFWFLL